MSTSFQPGQEVRLTNGMQGVLFARTQPVRKRFTPDAPVTWYFLPDVRGVAGPVVMSQPREIQEPEIAHAGPVRAGVWPSARHRLTAAQRQAVYVAHMRSEPLPVLD